MNNSRATQSTFKQVGYLWAHLGGLILVNALLYSVLRSASYTELFSYGIGTGSLIFGLLVPYLLASQPGQAQTRFMLFLWSTGFTVTFGAILFSFAGVPNVLTIGLVLTLIACVVLCFIFYRLPLGLRGTVSWILRRQEEAACEGGSRKETDLATQLLGHERIALHQEVFQRTKLTPLQKQVVDLSRRGEAAEEIATKLGISKKHVFSELNKAVQELKAIREQVQSERNIELKPSGSLH